MADKSIKWDEKDILGRGCMGTVVFRGHFNLQQVAVKRIQITNVQHIERELKTLQDCGHPRVLRLLHFEKDDQFLRLALELCAASLEDYCKGQYRGPIPRDNEVLKQMLEGLAYIHSRNYAHRDVKPQNILISESGDIKIADFGVCKSVTGLSGTFSLSAGVGTSGWLAPELLKTMTELESGLTDYPNATNAIDVFALGCVFYYFLTKGKHPFGSDLFRNAYIMSEKYNLSELTKKSIYRGIIKEMINKDPIRRPKLKELLKRPIFNMNNLNPDELLRDDKKFKNLLKVFGKLAISKKKDISHSHRAPAHMNTDECDYNGRKTEINYYGSLSSNFKMTTISSCTPLQIVTEERNSDGSVRALNTSTTRPRARSDLTTRRSGVSSAPLWQRTIPSRRQIDKMFVMSECYPDGEDGEDSVDSPRFRSVTSLTNIDTSEIEYSETSVSTLSLASSTTNKSGSVLSLARSFIGELIQKSP